MAVEDPTPVANGVNEFAHGVEVNTLKLCHDTNLVRKVIDPATKKSSTNTASKPRSKPQSKPGPIIHNQPTTATLYESRDLEAAGLIPGLYELINDAFALSHGSSGTMPATSLRLQSHQQLVKELSGHGTFTYLITYTGTQTVIAVASAKRYHVTAAREPARIDVPKSAFTRTGESEPNTEGYELSSMAVLPSLQRQGLAGLLMDLIEVEVKRRFLLARVEDRRDDVGLLMLLTTVKEINWDFYVRRHYKPDYETFHGPGWSGSKTGFTVVHMSKRVEL